MYHSVADGSCESLMYCQPRLEQISIKEETKLFFFFQYRGLNPGPSTFYASALPVSYITAYNLILNDSLQQTTSLENSCKFNNQFSQAGACWIQHMTRSTTISYMESLWPDVNQNPEWFRFQKDSMEYVS